jgi:hypothetical protein
MNKVDLFVLRNRNKQKLSNAFSFKVNVVKNKANTSLEHSLTKARICYFLECLGVHYITEAIFKNGKRADVYVLDKDVALEVIDSEGLKSVGRKIVDYPCDVRVVSVSDFELIDLEFVEKFIN